MGCRYSSIQFPTHGFGGVTIFSSATPMLNTPDLTTPGYSVLDVAISYRINRISLNLNINNITDKRYYTGALRATERYYVGAPRNMILRIGYTL